MGKSNSRAREARGKKAFFYLTKSMLPDLQPTDYFDKPKRKRRRAPSLAKIEWLDKEQK